MFGLSSMLTHLLVFVKNWQLCENDKEERSRDQIPVYLTEQNARAHQLAYQLQQAFVQARIDGLGKPYQVFNFSFHIETSFPSHFVVNTDFSIFVKNCKILSCH